MTYAPVILTEDQQRVGELEQVILDALAAMDRGEYGDARRILRTGKAGVLKPGTGVLVKLAGRL